MQTIHTWSWIPNGCKCNLCKQYIHGVGYLTGVNVTSMQTIHTWSWIPNGCKCNLCKQYIHGVGYLTGVNVTYANNTYMELDI